MAFGDPSDPAAVARAAATTAARLAGSHEYVYTGAFDNSRYLHNVSHTSRRESSVQTDRKRKRRPPRDDRHPEDFRFHRRRCLKDFFEEDYDKAKASEFKVRGAASRENRRGKDTVSSQQHYSPAARNQEHGEVEEQRYIQDDTASEDTSESLVLDEATIWANLVFLNKWSKPRLNHENLEAAFEHVLGHSRHLISCSVLLVWDEYCEVIARVLLEAKGQVGQVVLETASCMNGRYDAQAEQQNTEVQHFTNLHSGKDSTALYETHLVDPRLQYYADMSSPTLGQFLVAISGFIKVRNEAQISDYLALEPPFGGLYQQMITELKQVFPKGSEEALDKKCEQGLSHAVEGADQASWSAFVRFMARYLAYLRDVDADPNRYLETYDLLSDLQKHANAALAHGPLGYLMLQTTIKSARLVCRLAIGLDKRPEIIRHLKSNTGGGMGDGDEAQETLPERAANSLRGAFNTCLADRSTIVGGLKDGRPEGKKQGIYIFANLILKILFQCRKTRTATNLFEQIENSAPPLAAYPKNQRVTYLYYLGRFWFQNNHFYRTQAALQQAYDECLSRPDCAKQRRQILVYLVASNIVLGRFPSQALLAQPEAAGLQQHFLPLCIAIRQGNLDLFRRHMYLDKANVDWMLYWRVLLQLRNRCEVLVWRSLIRKTFLLAGRQPERDGASKIAPTLDVDAIVTTFTSLINASTASPGPNENNIDADFDPEDVREEEGVFLPDSYAIESILSSLVTQGLLGGYVSHKLLKFAITGASRKGVMAAGFPQPWAVMNAKAGSSHVPGWKKESTFGGNLNGGPKVISLSGARAAGS